MLWMRLCLFLHQRKHPTTLMGKEGRFVKIKVQVGYHFQVPVRVLILSSTSSSVWLRSWSRIKTNLLLKSTGYWFSDKKSLAKNRSWASLQRVQKRCQFRGWKTQGLKLSQQWVLGHVGYYRLDKAEKRKSTRKKKLNTGAQELTKQRREYFNCLKKFNARVGCKNLYVATRNYWKILLNRIQTS